MVDTPESTAGTLAIAGGGALVVSTVLPWASVGSLEVTGLDVDGVVLVALGVGVLWLSAIRDWDRRGAAATGVIGAFSLWLTHAVYDDLDGVSQFGRSGEVTPEIGLQLAIVASAAIVAGGVLGYRNADESSDRSTVVPRNEPTETAPNPNRETGTAVDRSAEPIEESAESTDGTPEEVTGESIDETADRPESKPIADARSAATSTTGPESDAADRDGLTHAEPAPEP